MTAPYTIILQEVMQQTPGYWIEEDLEEMAEIAELSRATESLTSEECKSFTIG